MRKSIIQLFSGNFLSKIFGLVREAITAALFGTGSVIGAFRVAQTGTLTPVNFFTSESLNATFIPQYRYFLEESRDKAQTLLWSLLFLFGILSLLIGVVLWLMAVTWVGVLAPGLETVTLGLAAAILQVMSISVPFHLLSSLLMFLCMANHDFVPMAVRPVVQNIGMIAGAILAYVLRDIMLLAWGFVASYVVYSIWLLYRTWSAGLLVLPQYWIWSRVGEVLTAFWITLKPLLFLPVMLQGNIVLERVVASFIGLAAISAMDYARFVSETLILLVSAPVAFVGLTHWSGLSRELMRQRLQKVLVLMLIVSIPASAFLAAHAHVVVEAVFARGAFDAYSVEVTGDILFGIAIGLWAQVIGYVLVKALNAQMRNQTVLWVMFVALLSNAVFNITMYPYLGAITLGLGNGIYGLLLLAGTLTVLGLWRMVFLDGWVIFLGGFGYLLLDHWLPWPDSVWSTLLLSSGFAIIYWLAFIVLIPTLRNNVRKVFLVRN